MKHSEVSLKPFEVAGVRGQLDMSSEEGKFFSFWYQISTSPDEHLA